MRRAFDLLFSLLILTLCSPLMALIALVIKSTSKGPIFYRGLRAGKGGKLFTCWKFRTMQTNAKAALEQLLLKSPELRQEWQSFQKLKKDPRVTAVGRVLRLFSLDELPQFLNVIRGDLSVVGPRPVEIYDRKNLWRELHLSLQHHTDLILSVKPGITGLWQTSGRNLLTAERRIALEMEYVQKQSLLLDLKIICKTVYIVLFPKGAY